MSAVSDAPAPYHARKPRTITPEDEIIRPRDLPQITGLSETTCWRLERAGDFPPKIRLSAGRVGYSRQALITWRESRQLA
jgi:prophage regulatory protein